MSAHAAVRRRPWPAGAALCGENRTASTPGGIDYAPFPVFRGPRSVILIADIGDVHPGVAHFVNGAIAESDPLIGIGIVGIGTRIVVPGSNTNHGAFRVHGRR